MVISKVPENCSIRVGDLNLKWKEGEAFIFDDSYEHEVWNNSDEEGIIFIMDILHPDLFTNILMISAFDMQIA